MTCCVDTASSSDSQRGELIGGEVSVKTILWKAAGLRIREEKLTGGYVLHGISQT